MDVKRDYQPDEELQSFFQRPSLVLGEDSEVFDLLYNQVLCEVQPQTIFEEMLVHDLVLSFWEQRQIRDASAEIITAARREAMALVLYPLLFGDLTAAVNMAGDFYSGDKEKRDTVSALMKRHGFTQATVTARATLQMAQVLSRFDAMIALRQDLREKIQENLDRSRKRQRKANRHRATAGAVSQHASPPSPPMTTH